MFCCVVDSEEHFKQISVAYVSSAWSRWITLGLSQLKSSCTSWIHTAQAPRCSARTLLQMDPVFCTLLRSKPFRFSGVLQGHRHRWPGWLVLFPALSSSGDRVLDECTLPVGRASYSPALSKPLCFPGVLQEHSPRHAVCLL